MRPLSIAVRLASRVSVILIPAVAVAQPASSAAAKKPQADKEAGKNADDVIKAYSVPESPAFSFLDVSPAKVVRPTTPRDFASSLVDAIDQTGHVRQGVAIEVQPSAIFRVGAGLAQYQSSPLQRALTNAQVSFATVRTAGDSTSTDFSYGLRLSIFDRADPMADRSFTGSLANVLGACSDSVGGAPPPLPTLDPAVARRLAETERAVALEKEGACNRAGIARLKDQYIKDHWNDLHVALSYAGGHRLTSSVPTAPEELGHRLWLVAGFPVATYGQILGYYRFSSVIPEDATVRTKASAYGGRAVVGKSTFNAFAELVGERKSSAGVNVDKQTSSWSGGLEFRVGDQLWISTGLGSAAQKDDGPTVVIANLKWGFSDKARFSPK
jgi:hypothetical protein